MKVTGDFHYLSHSPSEATLVKSIQMIPIMPMLQDLVTNIVGRRTESGRNLGGWSWRSLSMAKMKYPIKHHICTNIFKNHDDWLRNQEMAAKIH